MKTYNTKHIQYIKAFEDLTDARVKDCFEYHKRIAFIVKNGDVHKAIGKNAKNVKRVQNKLNKKIKVVEYSENTKKFIENVLKPLNIKRVEKDNQTYTIIPEDERTKSIVIGRGGSHIELIRDIIKRHHDYDKLRVQ